MWFVAKNKYKTYEKNDKLLGLIIITIITHYYRAIKMD